MTTPVAAAAGRIGTIEGYGVDDARTWAVDSGWEVFVIDIDNPQVEPRPARTTRSSSGCTRETEQ
jgi:hypothetical protein